MTGNRNAASLAALACTLLFTTPLAAQEQPPAESTIAATQASGWDPADWDLEGSDFEPESGWHFGKLDNGLRYIIRPNNRPENTALVRMEIATGSLDENDDERGFAHFVEHMAFNGSARVPEGEMVKLLEREGLAFGADTNASTGFDRTQYKLDLPRNDAALLDTALMLMRETASALTFAPEAVEREKGVVLSERRVRNNYALKNTIDQLAFTYPDARAPQRLPIGTVETIEGAEAARLKAFWAREYVPADTVVVVTGDFDPALVHAKIAEHFADWQPAPSPDQPDAGPVDPDYAGATDIYLDPALTETIAILRHAPYQDRPDSLAERGANVLRQIGERALGRRLQRLQRSEDPPFRGVSINVSDFLKATRTQAVGVATEDGAWKRGLDTALDEYRRALQYGFSEAEIAEQVSNMRTGYENAAANADTRSNASFVNAAFAMAGGYSVADSPAERLARFEALVPRITPEAVLAAMRAEHGELTNPLIRFTGKAAPEGGAQALRNAVQEALARPVAPPQMTETTTFAYTDFGTPGTVVEDSRTAELDIRTIRFANNVRLNIKRTDLSKDRVSVRFALDGGTMLASKDDPLAVELTGLLVSGGLGFHSLDELQSVLAGRSVGGSFGAAERVFTGSRTTTPRDLELQLQLMAAYLADPGYRAEGLGPWRASLDDFFARLGKTPGSAYGEAIGPILSDKDPRFTRQPIEAYRALDFEGLRNTIADRRVNGAIEIAIVGDIDEDEAIALVAKTFGAMPLREAEFRDYTAERQRSFTETRGVHTIYHDGEPDQAMIEMIWPTDDNGDWDKTSQLTLLARAAQIMLTDSLREELGQTYSASASSSMSETWHGFGTFSMRASVDVAQVEAANQAMRAIVERLRSAPIDPDVLQRARQPILESLDNRLKSNTGWMNLVDHAQSDAGDIMRFTTARARYEAMTGEDLQVQAQRYLDPAAAVDIRVLPRPAKTSP